MMKCIVIACGIVLTTLSATAQYSLVDAFPNLSPFTSPLEMTHAGDGTNRLFVVQQTGSIYVFENKSTASSRKLFLDLSDKINSGFELGLLGLAFHPNYETNGYFFVNYTRGSFGQRESVIARYRVSDTNPDSALKGSELILLTFSQPFDNHNGGKLAFGPDRYLYIASGDGGGARDTANNAQNRATLLGKLLRIDVDNTEGNLNYAIPPSNPYYDNSQGFREEIYAYGLRNPWKFSFDSITDNLWLGDVGQSAREEINIIVNGGNYGWRLMEGFLCTPEVNPNCQDTAGLLPPVWDYMNGDGAGADYSVTGGYVYRGSTIPLLYGKYIYSDYGSGKVWALTYDGVNPANNQLLYDSEYQVSSLGEDKDGELFVVSFLNGRIYRLAGPLTHVAETESAPPAFLLHQNYPNPFNPSTTVRFSVNRAQNITLRAFDVLGRHVATLVEERLHPGEHSVIFEPKGYSSGIFFLRLEAEGAVQTRTVIYQK